MAAEMTGVACGDRFMTHEAFVEATRRAARGLLALGLQHGGCVALLLRNDISFLVAQAAATHAGGHAVPINWHSSTDDIGYVLRDCSASVLIVHADLLERVRDVVPDQCRILVVPTPVELQAAYGLSAAACRIRDDDTEWEAWIKENEALAETGATLRGELGIYYTSGTTGRPKGVMREPADAAAIARMIGVVDEIFGVAPGAAVRVLVSAPVYHGAPNFFANRGTAAGSLTVLQPRFDPEGLLQLIERYRVTHLYLVPTTMIKLLELPPAVRSKYDLSSLRRAIHAAAPCPKEVKQQMIEWLGPVIYEFYGGTENGITTLLGSEEALRKPGSVGKLMSNCGLKIYDDAGREVAPGEIGEVYSRNFNLPKFTYRHLPAKQAEVERDGLITLGDVGYVDEDGYLFLCDRKRDMVISAGVNIYPAQIEAVLLGMPGIADCAVFGVPDEVFGEAICAHVELKEGVQLAPQQILVWLQGRLASYQVPRSIRIDARLPREESGKIMKRKIRDRYWARTGRAI
jgi:long-chain acyl-CoA synthetase